MDALSAALSLALNIEAVFAVMAGTLLGLISVPSVSALNASGGMMECSPTTEESVRSRSKP
jgi:hypothetical protein